MSQAPIRGMCGSCYSRGLRDELCPAGGWDAIAPEKREQIHGKWGAAAEAIAANVIGETMRLLRAGVRINEVEDDLRETFSSSTAPAITYSGDSA